MPLPMLVIAGIGRFSVTAAAADPFGPVAVTVSEPDVGYAAGAV